MSDVEANNLTYLCSPAGKTCEFIYLTARSWLGDKPVFHAQCSRNSAASTRCLKKNRANPMLFRTVTYSNSDQVVRAQNLRIAFYWAVAFALGLWLIKAIEIAFGFDFSRFGVSPGRFNGLDGILFAPLIHGSWSHLASNTPPIVVLGTAVRYAYPRSAKIVLPVLYLGTGIGVWLFACETTHYGASGLSFGMMFFVFTIGALRWDRQAIALSMIVFFLYGSMIWGLFPHDPTVSFETHLSGTCLGVLLAVYCRNWDPAPPEKRYSWEDEETENDDDSSWREQ